MRNVQFIQIRIKLTTPLSSLGAMVMVTGWTFSIIQQFSIFARVRGGIGVFFGKVMIYAGKLLAAEKQKWPVAWGWLGESRNSTKLSA